MKPLAQASRNLVESDDIDHDNAMMLFGLGRCVGASFLLAQGVPYVPPAFTLNSTEVLHSVLSKEGHIMLFCQYLEQYYLEQFVFESAIIRYVQPLFDMFSHSSILSTQNLCALFLRLFKWPQE